MTIRYPTGCADREPSSFGTMRNLFKKNLIYYISEIFSFWPSTSLRRPTSIIRNEILFFENTVTISTRRGTTIQRCNSTSRLSTIRSHLRSFGRSAISTMGWNSPALTCIVSFSIRSASTISLNISKNYMNTTKLLLITRHCC